jgi:hypothetical protein
LLQFIEAGLDAKMGKTAPATTIWVMTIASVARQLEQPARAEGTRDTRRSAKTLQGST